MAKIDIYTDGAASGNPGPGGYGVVMLSGEHKKELMAGFQLTTNNRMELLAVIVALQTIKGSGHEVTIYSDSKYVVDAINLGWLSGWVKRGFAKVKNPDLWKAMLPLLGQHRPKFVWVKGHASNFYNNRCDELAVKASKMSGLSRDVGYESSL